MELKVRPASVQMTKPDEIIIAFNLYCQGSSGKPELNGEAYNICLDPLRNRCPLSFISFTPMK
jgi:hypothetical protein